MDILPPSNDDCASDTPIYIESGATAANKNGSWMPGLAGSTLTRSAETWHKCCLPKHDDGGGTMVCEKVNNIEYETLKKDYSGYCGNDLCLGYRERCLEETVHVQYQEVGGGFGETGCGTRCGSPRCEIRADGFCLVAVLRM